MSLQAAARRFGALLRRFSADSRGNIVVLGAVLLLPLTLLAGGASDYARARQVKVELQDALDAALLAGVRAADPAAASTAAFEAPALPGVSVSAPRFGPTTSGGVLPGSVSAQVPNSFLSAAGVSSFTVLARGGAALRPGPNDVCLTIVGTSSSALTKAGSSALTGENCKFDVRSTASPAASFAGSGSVITEQLCVRGSTVASNGSTVTGLQLNCTLAAPYRAEPVAPAVGGCSAVNATVGGGSIPPGVYCGTITIDGAAATTLLPGDYVLKGTAPGTPGSFTIRGSGAVTGNGVSIYFADHSTLRLEGTGELRLTAPTAGPRQGVLFHEAPGLPQSTINITRSGAGLFRGVMNLPSRNLFVASSGTTTTDELTMVVNRLTTEGSGAWRFTSAPPSVADRLRGFPYLVE